MVNFIFSPSENAFYPNSLMANYVAAGSWPKDGIDVDDAVFYEFTGEPPAHKIRAVDDDGCPVWSDIPPVTHEMAVAAAEEKKSMLILGASESITPLQDAVELGMATDAEKSRFDAWRKYRVLLTRVDTSLAPDVNWPDVPEK